MDIDQLDRILIARSASFGGEAHKLLWYLTLRLEFDRFSIVNISETSWDLGLRPQAVSRALKALIDEGFIERGPRVGKRHTFRFARAVERQDRSALSRVA